MYKYIRYISENERDMSDGVDLSQKVDGCTLPDIPIQPKFEHLHDMMNKISLDVEYFTERQEVVSTTLENDFEKELLKESYTGLAKTLEYEMLHERYSKIHRDIDELIDLERWMTKIDGGIKKLQT